MLVNSARWGPCIADVAYCKGTAVAAVVGAGIIGANGAGKSTLFRMLVGQEQPDSGELVVGKTVKTMYVDQSREALASDRSASDTGTAQAE